jgi:hypothetical protein
VSKSCVPQPFQIEEINFRTCFSEVENFVTIYRFFSGAIRNPDHVAERIFEMVVSMLLPHAPR